MVFVTKYRAKVLTGEIADSMEDDIEEILTSKGCEPLETEVMEDHVHILFEAPPSISLAALANVLKSTTARRARTRYPEHVGRFFWKPVFWTDSYFVATVSERTRDVVASYIRNQR